MIGKTERKGNNKTGLIFHIIHGSFVDGHGVRTTIFLKGCPLRCLWCCNPEGQQGHPEIKFTAALCDGCGRCIKACPVNAIRQPKENDKVEIDKKLCTNCGKCIDVCYTQALDFFGKYVTVDELFDIVKRDDQFYRASGGGVTIGGGEPTFQPLFTHALIKKCKENYIHTAVDTCGYALNGEGIKVLDEADLLLYDLKDMDPKSHLKNTSAPLKLILENIKRSNDLGKSIIIRIPLISGHNDSPDNIENMAAFLCRLKSVERVDLLPYHQYGKIKYEQLGKEYKLNIQSPTTEHVNDIKETFERYGLKVQIGG